jgi:hypothetical protein
MHHFSQKNTNYIFLKQSNKFATINNKTIKYKYNKDFVFMIYDSKNNNNKILKNTVTN